MNLILHIVLHLYPAWWRKRYGDEFNALLDEVRPGIGGVLDILKGALAMQLSTPGNLRTIGLTTVVGLVAVSIFGLMMEHQFRSTAYLKTNITENATIQDSLDSLRRMGDQVLSRESLSKIADNLNLYPDLSRTERLARMKSGIQFAIDRYPDNQETALSISFVYPDRAVANRVVQDLTSRFLDTSIEQHEQATSEELAPVIPSLTVLDSANLPDKPIQPAWGGILTIGLLGGLGLGFVVILFQRLTSRGNGKSGNGVGVH